MEPNGGGEAGDSGADDDDIEGALFFHGALMILSLCFSSSLIYFIILSKNNALEDWQVKQGTPVVLGRRLQTTVIKIIFLSFIIIK